LTPSPITSS